MNPCQEPAPPPDSTGPCSQNTTPLPVALIPKPENIPARLKERNHWTVWRYELKDGRYTKVPYQPNGRKASTTKCRTWSTFTEVWAAYERGGWDGIGYVLDYKEKLTGIDRDHCVEGGQLTPDAQADVEHFDSYSERSPSGEGVRIFVEGTLDGLKGRKKPGREIYNNVRYLTVTGHIIAGAPRTIRPRQQAINEWHAQWFPPKARASTPSTPPAVRLDLDDSALVEKATASQNGVKFARLWKGDTSDYAGDASAADQALCNMLRFWTQGDTGRMDSLFRQSGLMRIKWDEVHYEDGQTYGQHTIATACDGGEVYSPPVPGNWPVLTAAPSPAMMAELPADPNAAPRDVELARLRAQNAALLERAERAESFNRALLKGLSNPYIRNEFRLIVAEATEYLSCLSRGAIDEAGLAWLYIGSKEDDGLAGRAGMSPRTISRQLDRHATYQVDGAPLVELREDEIESSDGRHRTRYRFKVPFLEAGGTLPALVEKLAEYEPPGVETGERQAPGGNRCRDCGGPLEREVQRFRRVQTIERARITCRECGQVHDEPERVLKTETHLERVQTIRLDLPEIGQEGAGTANPTSPAMMAELPDAPCAADAELASSVIVAELDDAATVGAAGPTSPAIMAEVVAAAPAPPESAATVEDHLGATPCPVPPTLLRCPDCGRPTLPNDKLSCVCARGAPPPEWPRLEMAPAPPTGPPLPPGFDHWCPGDHQFPVPLPARAERCSAHTRPWRAPGEAP